MIRLPLDEAPFCGSRFLSTTKGHCQMIYIQMNWTQKSKEKFQSNLHMQERQNFTENSYVYSNELVTDILFIVDNVVSNFYCLETTTINFVTLDTASNVMN